MSHLFELISYIDDIRQRMEELIMETDPRVELCPGWTIKEAVGHITAWEIVIHKAIQAYVADDPPFFLHEQDFDRFNQEAVSERSEWTVEEVLQEWQDVRAKLRGTILGLTESVLDKELVLPWGSERTMAELIEILGEHESEHLENIIKVTG